MVFAFTPFSRNTCKSQSYIVETLLFCEATLQEMQLVIVLFYLMQSWMLNMIPLSDPQLFVEKKKKKFAG